jgi:hypothetical protein
LVILLASLLRRVPVNELYPWWVYLHVLGAFTFAAAHGASAIAAFRIRSTRDPSTIRTLLDLSSIAIGVMYVGLLMLLIGGIVAGVVGGHFGRGWIWASLGLLVLVIIGMYMLATPFYKRVREAVGTGPGGQPLPDAPPPATDAELAALAGNSRPMLLTLVGLVGFVVILWLMLFKPF